jgi:hypothetical protein
MFSQLVTEVISLTWIGNRVICCYPGDSGGFTGSGWGHRFHCYLVLRTNIHPSKRHRRQILLMSDLHAE